MAEQSEIFVIVTIPPPILRAGFGVMETLEPITWPITTNRPACYTDLISATQNDLKDKFSELWERAENAYRAIINLEKIKDLELARDVDRDKLMELLAGVPDHGDDKDLEWLNLLISDWETIRTEPDQGYW